MKAIPEDVRKIWETAIASTSGTIEITLTTKAEATTLRHRLYRARIDHNRNMSDSMEGAILTSWDDYHIHVDKPAADGTTKVFVRKKNPAVLSIKEVS